jgi:hypothetical protein
VTKTALQQELEQEQAGAAAAAADDMYSIYRTYSTFYIQNTRMY